ncbi:MAG TPA: YebC/PmpR family DNA-binding transcriptional regulator [Spirochaetia bacterium]|nr:YebC/PmpR family DNA-binding transcriptional regulator [Spirochaetia bacterium]
MSGHSKWSTIKHQKAVEDNKRGAVFTKIAKKIHIAVKKGGSGDVVGNHFLRACVDEARAVNMPMENIKRAVEKGLGAGGANTTEEVIYEAYSREGVGIMITAVTDNRNRTATEMNSVLNKHEAKLGGPGSVSYMKSISSVPMVKLDEESKEKVNELIETLTDLDDVVDIWSNME